MEKSKFSPKILWYRVTFWLTVHLIAGYGIIKSLLYVHVMTYLWALLVALLGTLGFTAGVHRLWAHRTYKAAWPLRALLLLFETFSPMCSALEWSREHRAHHRHSESDADPHNIARGFFFSHLGWLMLEPHPSATKQIAAVDTADLRADPLIMLQHRWFHVIWPLVAVLGPCSVPCCLWGETTMDSLLVVGAVRILLVLHVKWLVNSAAHSWGSRPYDKSLRPAENLVISVLALGEGWHNFHHVFPWDYKTSELGNYGANFSTAFIDLCARLGLAYDLKTASPKVISERKQRTGQAAEGPREDISDLSADNELLLLSYSQRIIDT